MTRQNTNSNHLKYQSRLIQDISNSFGDMKKGILTGQNYCSIYLYILFHIHNLGKFMFNVDFQHSNETF